MRITRTSQPQVPVGIDWGNPLSRGLSRTLNPPAISRDWSFTGNRSSYAGVDGLSVELSSIYATTAVSGIEADGFSLYAKWTVVYGNTADVASLFNGASYRTLIYVSGGDNLYVFYNGASATQVHTAKLVAGNRVSCALVYSAGSIKVSATVNGVTQNTTISVTLSGSYDSLNAGGRFTAHTNRISLCALWNRALSDTEIKSLSDNPWQIFAPINRPIFVGLSASSGDPSATADQLILPLDQTATATVTAQATASQALADVTQSATAVAVSESANAAATQQIELVTQAATAVSISAATASQQLPDLGQSATSTAIASATASQQIGVITQSATATAPIPGVATATANQQLPDFTQAATSTATASARASQQLDAFVSVQTCVAIAQASASSQIEAFTQSATVVTVVGDAVYPLASQVLLGVMYGPTGIEYTGTLTGGPTAADIAAAVWAYTQ